MPQNYDETEVEQWMNDIENVIDAELDVGDKTAAEESLRQVERHYEKGVELVDEQGLSEEACYEFEVAYSLLERFKQDKFLKVESEQYDF